MHESIERGVDFHRAARETGLPEKAVIAITQISPLALGVASGVVVGLWILVGTSFLVIRGDEPLGPHLALLAEYFPFYEISIPGAVLGFGYGAVTGFLFGSLFAHLRNKVIHLFLLFVWLRGEEFQSPGLLDRVS